MSANAPIVVFELDKSVKEWYTHFMSHSETRPARPFAPGDKVLLVILDGQRLPLEGRLSGTITRLCDNGWEAEVEFGDEEGMFFDFWPLAELELDKEQI